MRVLFVISSLDTGGAQRVVSNIACNLPQGWEIDILLNNAGNIKYPYRGNLIDLRLRIPQNRDGLVYQLKVLARRFIMLKKLKKELIYDACVSHLDSANIVNVLTGKKHCKTVLTVHNCLSQYKTPVRRLVNLIIRFFYNRADCVVAVSEGMRLDLVSNLGVRADIVTTICNGYPIDDIRRQAGARSAGDNVFTFVTMGRCDRQKGQWHLLRAFAEFAKRHAGSRLVILGDGAYLDYLRQLAAGYGVEGKVLLKGFADNPFAELINADVFVLSSLFEGLPCVIIEAMACSLPVIAADFRSGAREILAPDTDIGFQQVSGVEQAQYGIITPVCSGVKYTCDDPPEPQELFLLEAMELLYSNEELRRRYSLASQERARDFSIEKCVEEWIEIISASSRP